jgi:DNA-binding HxlR family transcriptional regulator
MEKDAQVCQYRLMASRDALNVISGKWKIPIIIALTFGDRRFGELLREIDGVSPKMLSKELKDLEESKLISRTVFDSMPVSIEYSLTPLGKTMQPLLKELYNWGNLFRKKILDKT